MTYYSQAGVPSVGSQWPQNNEPCMPSSTLQNLLYAFPKPRLSGRVSKPRSAGTSPSSTGRRRTTTMPQSSPMYHQPPSQDYQASLNSALLASAFQSSRRSRPTSWHPASRRQQEYSMPQHYYPSGTTMNSYDFPISQATLESSQVMNNAFDGGSMLHSYAPPGISASQHTFANPTESDLSIHHPSYLQTNDPQFDGVSWDGSTPGLTPSFVHPASNGWPFEMMSMNQSVPFVGAPASNYDSVSSPGRLTEPVTPDFLPIQQFGDNVDSQSLSIIEKGNSEDELVGMGLYNNPETLTEGSLYGLNGKGLKLEETFTPSSDNEADENEAEDDDHQESNDSSASQTQQQSHQQYDSNNQANNLVGNMIQKSFFFEDDDNQQRATAETRPPFNFGATPCMNYGYGWI
ncbi:hypothetical protein BJX70DRAFT_207965 [Aspergillus crustosus]